MPSDHYTVCPGRPGCGCDAQQRCASCGWGKVYCDSLAASFGWCCADCKHERL